MTEYEKMLHNLPYDYTDKEVQANILRAYHAMRDLNQCGAWDMDELHRCIRALIPDAHHSVIICPPFHCDHGNRISIGEGSFVNFNGVFLDGGGITIGAHTLIGPNCQLLTPDHPHDYLERRQTIETGKPIRIGDDCWLGGGVIVCPGVTIGNRVIVGAGSVVTHDIPDDVVVAGNPAKIIKKMNSVRDYLLSLYQRNSGIFGQYEISSCPQLIERIQQLGFLPLLDSGIDGYCAEEMMAPDYHYVQFDDGSWEWPLWTWKGPAITEGNCVYGKFFGGKAGFISREWWRDFYNYRRSIYPQPEIGSVEEAILTTLREQGSAIARDLRAACGMTGPKMRSRFDAYVNRLQMGCYIVTEDFVYPRDKHGKEYGFGWQLLNTPENLLGREACLPYTDETHTVLRTPQESYERILAHLQEILPEATDKQLNKLIK